MFWENYYAIQNIFNIRPFKTVCAQKISAPFQQNNQCPKRKDRNTSDGMQSQQFQRNVEQYATFIV